MFRRILARRAVIGSTIIRWTSQRFAYSTSPADAATKSTPSKWRRRLRGAAWVMYGSGCIGVGYMGMSKFC
jgi:hypothetical protein